MNIAINPKHKAVLFIAETEPEEKIIMEMVNQRAEDEIRQSRSLSTVIPQVLYHVRSAEESEF